MLSLAALLCLAAAVVGSAEAREVVVGVAQNPPIASQEQPSSREPAPEESWLLWLGLGAALVLVLALSGNLVLGRLVEVRARKLRESEERFRDFALSASDWFWEMDGELRFSYISERYFEISGRQPEEVMGKSRWEFAQPHQKSEEPKKWARYRDDLENHRAIENFEYAIEGPSQEGTHIRINGIPFFGPNGEFRGYRGTGRDITQQKRAEEELRASEKRFRLIADAMPIPVLITRFLDGVIVYASPATGEMYQCPSDSIVGTLGADLWHDTEKREEWLARISESEAPVPYEAQGAMPDGSTRWVMGTGRKIDFEGEPCLLSLFYDLEEQKSLAEQLSRAQQMELVGQLTGGVAHDFNNLLTVIVSNLNFALQDAAADPNMVEILESALAAAERGGELTHHLLAFSRQQALIPEAVDLAALVGDIVKLLRRTLEESIEIIVEAGDLAQHAYVDRAHLQSALVNLAVNARDAMPGGGRLSIALSRCRLDPAAFLGDLDSEVVAGEYALIAVRDSGTGIAPEILEKVIEPFFTTKGMATNSGLGLSMVHGFARQSGGHLEIVSGALVETKGGTEVRLYLPLAPACTAQESAEQSAAAPAGGSESILLVEDDEAVRLSLSRGLERLGYQVAAAADGRDALAILKDRRFDLLVSDIVMPGGLSGLDLYHQARERNSVQKIILISGYSDAMGAAGSELGEDGVRLHKPFTQAAFAKAVRRALDQA